MNTDEQSEYSRSESYTHHQLHGKNCFIWPEVIKEKSYMQFLIVTLL